MAPELDIEEAVVQADIADRFQCLLSQHFLDMGRVPGRQRKIVDNPGARIGIGIRNRPERRLGIGDPALDCHLRPVNKVFDQHDLSGGQGELLAVDIALEKRQIEGRPGRIFPSGDRQCPLEVVVRFELKTEDAEVQPGRFEITRIARNRRLLVRQIDGLTADRMGLILTTIVFVEAEKNRLHTRSRKPELLAQDRSHDIGHVAGIENGINGVGLDIIAALVGIRQQVQFRGGRTWIERRVEQMKPMLGHAGQGVAVPLRRARNQDVHHSPSLFRSIIHACTGRKRYQAACFWSSSTALKSAVRSVVATLISSFSTSNRASLSPRTL